MRDSKNNKLGELISMNGRLQEIQDLINKYKEDNPDESVGELSDTYHSFNDLYKHRTVLTALAFRFLPYAWKSRHHEDGTMYDGGADDNYFLHSFQDVQNYSDKKNGVCLEWNYFTEGRAKQIIEYIKNALQNTTSIELWHVWLMDYYEFEDRPVIHKQTVSIDELTTKHIKEIDDAEIWNTPDKMYPNRPSFYCLEIKR